MEHSDSLGGGCKISMLWNWNTIDACFISAHWHIRTTGAFVGSVLAVFALVILLEAVRRVARAYDRRIAEEYMARWAESEASEGLVVSQFSRAVSPTIAQQAVRSALYTVQLGVGYMLMLLAMSYNGYILLFGIYLGAWAGFFLHARSTVGSAEPTIGGVTGSSDCH